MFVGAYILHYKREIQAVPIITIIKFSQASSG